MCYDCEHTNKLHFKCLGKKYDLIIDDLKKLPSMYKAYQYIIQTIFDETKKSTGNIRIEANIGIYEDYPEQGIKLYVRHENSGETVITNYKFDEINVCKDTYSLLLKRNYKMSHISRNNGLRDTYIDLVPLIRASLRMYDINLKEKEKYIRLPDSVNYSGYPIRSLFIKRQKTCFFKKIFNRNYNLLYIELAPERKGKSKKPIPENISI